MWIIICIILALSIYILTLPIKEGLDGLDGLVDGFKKVGVFMSDANTDGSLANKFKRTGDGLNAVGPSLLNGIKKIASELQTGTADLGAAFNDGFVLMGNELNADINTIGAELVNESKQINDNAIYITNDIATFFTDFHFLFEYVDDFFKNYISAYLTCGLNKIFNLKTCIMYYILDTIGQMLYLPIRLVIFIVYHFFGVDIQSAADMAWDLADEVDTNIIQYVTGGYSLLHYPDNIIGTCYQCRDKTGKILGGPPSFPKQVFIDDLTAIKTDIVKMSNDLYPPLQQIGAAFNRMGPGLNDGFMLMGNKLKTAGDEIKAAFPNGFNEVNNELIAAGNTIKSAWN